MLEVHQEESPGEPMKPLSELVKEIRARQEACSGDLEEPLAALAHDCWKQCADELQAWLREADDPHRERRSEMLRQLKPIDQTAIVGALSLALQRVEAETGLVESLVVRRLREKFSVKLGELMLKYLKDDNYLP
ncbi:hypothetical protein LCGC14_1221740 [marine sediment metagenome]|uniref:Uncharacterized protein n=1 Tax=marine sediment metagenome TaxID=412755 RepID=A0A0F9NTC2_9ZZZZ